MSYANLFNADAGAGLSRAFGNALTYIIPKTYRSPARPKVDAPAPYVAGSPRFKTMTHIRMAVFGLPFFNFFLMLFGYFGRRPNIDYAMEQGIWVQFASNVFLIVIATAATKGKCLWKPWKRTTFIVLYAILGVAAAVGPLVNMKQEADIARVTLYGRYGPALYLQCVLTLSGCICIVLLFVENHLAIKNCEEEWRLFNPEEARVQAMMSGEAMVTPTRQSYSQQDFNPSPPEYTGDFNDGLPAYHSSSTGSSSTRPSPISAAASAGPRQYPFPKA
ncbi:hypothetical protein EMPS_10937 [Entomortierella parvispora]|uniref:Uncharacterized protein n=1 Tax=Entomortierella parvispora TaxID=205924 RepID=A0A9P3M1S0_9FUNG|nr:hypothetical protein EMPS_10937 [Entomortierella parvispora]